jgi:hypothetical protein
LHFADGPTIEAGFPVAIKELFLVADHLYAYMELKMLYIQRSVGRRINADLHLFFTIHSLERIAAEPGLRLIADAGRLIDEAFCRKVYGYEGCEPSRSNEADIIDLLCGFVRRLWAVPERAI